MKKIFLMILLMSTICSFAFAGVSSQRIDRYMDENGNIRVVTKYTLDDGTTIDVKAQACIDCVQGFRISFDQVDQDSGKMLGDMTSEELEIFIEKIIEDRRQNLIARRFSFEQNKSLMSKINQTSVLKSTETATVKISETDEWIVSTDGTKTVNPIAIEVVK